MSGPKKPRPRNQVSNTAFVGSFTDVLPAVGLPEIAFAGRSNVGKSSALNCLLNSKSAARVSSTPGRTQAINLFRIGDVAVFADLPGYGYAKVPAAVKDAWKRAIESYLVNRDELALVVLLVDARREPQVSDGQLLYSLVEAKVPSLVVATKADKLKKAELQRSLSALRASFRLPADQPVAFSAMTASGRDEVWDRIEAAILGEGRRSGGES